MATSTPTLARRNGLLLLPAIIKLANWRFKQMWRFLFVTWLGMLAMVILVCALPLFSRVAISADLRASAVNSQDGPNILVQVFSVDPTMQQVGQVTQQVHTLLQQNGFSPYLQVTPNFVVQAPPLTVLATGNAAPASLMLDGYDPASAAQHLTVVSGRVPQATTNGTVEIALTPGLASSLKLYVGDTVQGHFPTAFGSSIWPLHIVGLINPSSTHDPFWIGRAAPFGSVQSFPDGTSAYSVLAPLQTLQTQMATLQSTPQGGKGEYVNSFHLIWSYPFNVSQLDANAISALSQQASNLGPQINNSLSNIPGVVFGYPFGSLFDTLSNYAQQVIILEIVVTFLLLITLALVLFLVSMLSDMLVERQAAIIATLRSRGATQRHIFGAFAAQSLWLGLSALLAGPFLAILLVRVIAQALLTPANQQSLSIITANPIQSALGVKWYALLAAVVALFVMIVSIRRASKLDIVTLRRESARSKRISFWRKLNLDLLVVLLIAVGYIAYAYFWQVLTSSQSFDPVFYNLLQGLGFLAPPLLITAALMLFLRLFPLILRLATSLVGKKRSAPAVLAIAQMQRAPRPAARIIVLLALAIASACFLLTLIATKQTRASDAATFAVGADFSGPLPASDATLTFAQLKTNYSHMAGVQSATIGYYYSIDTQDYQLRVVAADAATYANTAIWTAQDSKYSNQPLSTLTAQLFSHRSDASSRDVVYALVDAALWQQLHLTPGASFTLQMNATGTLQMHFVALAEVNYIPGIYDTPLNPRQGVGFLVDYQSFATVYAKDSAAPLSPNSILLRTNSDAASLAHIRAALPGLQDRRQLATANQQNGAHLDIIGVLEIGVGVALILALVGTLLSSWLDASNRRTSFAVVRALGMTPRQVASVLLWQQCLIYILAFLLGIALGALLTIFVTPIVSLLDLAGPTGQSNPYDVPPIQALVPYPQLLLLFGALVIICLAALLLMARIVSRPSISQTLRLNED